MITPGANSLRKEERLSGKKDIGLLLDKGCWGSSGPLKFCWRPNDCGVSRIIISVPKRNFKRAVRRNLLKRRIREAFRTQKNLLEGTNVDILFVYNSKEVIAFADIFSCVTGILSEVAEKKEKEEC